jgi:predicted acylesterase/phospholipase RssA
VTTAFVLSGGACLGAAQAGMLEALYERGVSPDLFIGTSVGAMNAAFAASRPATNSSLRAARLKIVVFPVESGSRRPVWNVSGRSASPCR